VLPASAELVSQTKQVTKTNGKWKLKSLRLTYLESVSGESKEGEKINFSGRYYLTLEKIVFL
jgi:hypothetical protein